MSYLSINSFISFCKFCRLVPGSKPTVSPDGIKTVYSNSTFEVKVDNLFNYDRVKNVKTNQYVDQLGNIPSMGHLQGKDAQNLLQQVTHIKNID